MAKHTVGKIVTWTYRGKTKTGTIRAIVVVGERLEDAKDRACDTNSHLDFRRLRINHENRTSKDERYLIELLRYGRDMNLESPDWVMPATSTVG